MSWLKWLFSGNKPRLMAWPAFAEHYAARLAQAVGVPVTLKDEAELDAASFVLVFEDDIQLTLSVRNRYLNYRQDADSTDAQLAHDLASIRATHARLRGEGEALQLGQVLPVIKNQEWGVELPRGKEVRMPLAGDLLLTFVADSEHSMRYLTPEDISALGVADESALFELARQNFAAYAEPRIVAEEQAPGLFRIRLDNVYDASLMLLIDALRQQLPEGALGERVVFAVPARNGFLLCNQGDAAAIAAMRAMVDEAQQTVPHTISARLYLQDERGGIQLLAE